MKYLLTFESYTGAIKTDNTPYSYDWFGTDITVGGDKTEWNYEKVPTVKRKIEDKEAFLAAKRKERRKRSLEIRNAKINVHNALNKDSATFARNTFTPGKAG